MEIFVMAVDSANRNAYAPMGGMNNYYGSRYRGMNMTQANMQPRTAQPARQMSPNQGYYYGGQNMPFAPNRNNMRSGNPQSAETAAPKTNESSCRRGTNISELLKAFNLDEEKLLIILLIIILAKDGGDMVMIVALAYLLF
ncbi:MAG: hypothetical protein ACI4JJ_01500 [Huintestinicola sp.]